MKPPYILPPLRYLMNIGINVKKNTIFKITKDINKKYFFSLFEKKLSIKIIFIIIVVALIINEIFLRSLSEKNNPKDWEKKYAKRK